MHFRIFVVILAVSLAGCGLIYRPDMRQGTPISEEAMANLKAGLTKRQVRLVLGSPTISDPFHPDRWDYVYAVGKAGDRMDPPPRLTLYFSNDVLVHADGELAPTRLRLIREVPDRSVKGDASGKDGAEDNPK